MVMFSEPGVPGCGIEPQLFSSPLNVCQPLVTPAVLTPPSRTW